MENGFSTEELRRYARQVTLPELGIHGQERLKNASVLVIGAGGLGCPVLLYLAAAGIGRIGIVDFDVVDISNLHRQVLFTGADIGKSKAQVAAAKLAQLNPHIQVEPHVIKLDSSNALELFSRYDIIADGSDNFPTRYLVNDACVLSGKPDVYAAVFRFTGQATVFNYKNQQGQFGPNYRDLHPLPPPPGTVPSCAEGGVLGVLPGILGSIQANEVIKIAAGIGEPLTGRIFVFNASNFSTTTLHYKEDPTNPVSGKNGTIKSLIDYENWCETAHGLKEVDHVREVTPVELERMIKENAGVLLIDVREPYEHEIVNLKGQLIPMHSIPANAQHIPRDTTVIVYCRSGIRSAQAIRYLQMEHNFINLYNLKGGVLAYADEVDPSMPKY